MRAIGNVRLVTSIYSMRRPEMARAMTSRWISEVPSKIVWLISWCPGRIAQGRELRFRVRSVRLEGADRSPYASRSGPRRPRHGFGIVSTHVGSISASKAARRSTVDSQTYVPARNSRRRSSTLSR